MNFTTHRDYNKYMGTYVKDYDCYQGQEEVKRKGTAYLPKLPAMALDKKVGSLLYDNFLSNALWFPATSTTVRGYLGLLFRKNPIVKLPEELDSLKDSFTDNATSLNQAATELARELIIRYRPAVLIDFPVVNDELTLEQINALKLKPYTIIYSADSIINWHEKIVSGVKKLDMVDLQEYHDTLEYSDNEIIRAMDSLEIIDGQYVIKRRLLLEIIDNQGQYYQELYIKRKKEKLKKDEVEWVLLSRKIPLMNGKPLDFIPFVKCSQDNSWNLNYSIINDLVNLNLADYRNEALYRDNLTLLARPTVVVAGRIIPDGKEDDSYIALGSSSFIDLEIGGSAELLGGDATQASALVISGENLKRQMSVIGLRSLMADGNGVEAAKTAQIHRSGESSTLSSIALAISDCLTKVLKIMVMWSGENNEDVSYEVQTDFIPETIDAELLKNLWAMYASGSLPLSQFLKRLQKGEIIDSTMTVDEFKEEIAESKPEEPMPIETLPVE